MVPAPAASGLSLGRLTGMTAAAPTTTARLMSAVTPLQQSWTQRCVAATGSQHYQTAFVKLVADPERGHLRWTAIPLVVQTISDS